MQAPRELILGGVYAWRGRAYVSNFTVYKLIVWTQQKIIIFSKQLIRVAFEFFK